MLGEIKISMWKNSQLQCQWAETGWSGRARVLLYSFRPSGFVRDTFLGAVGINLITRAT